MKRIFFLLSGLFLIFAFVSCNKDDTPEVSMKDALKISAYVYNEDGETWGFQQLPLKEPKKLVPTYVLEQEGVEMQNFNFRFEYEDGICVMSAPDRDMQLSVGKNGGMWQRGEDMSTRVYDFQNGYELTLSRPGYMAAALYGMKNYNIYAAEEVAPVLDNFEAYIGQEYYLTVRACDFEQNPVITAQVKLTSLPDEAYDDGTSTCFSIEIVSYEYSDFYKMMEGAG
ncbi:MAG: hypothetical protein IJV76_08925 [Clostridia bacterium]|nr:hypothetical protein [Clostridia bacterium]